MKHQVIFVLGALALVSCQTASLGADAPEESAPLQQRAAIKAGYDLSEALCSGCHAIAIGQISPNPESPPFAMIANTPNLTQATLKDWLRDSHNFPEKMNFEVAEEDVDALAAYIITLRSPEYAPPT